MRNPAILWGTLVDAVRKARKNCKRDPFLYGPQKPVG